nr:hypothetical protein GCM10017745_50090 [Saccharothrix mutabilis subsp. capreolus]
MVDDLLLPLTLETHANGAPVCRLLVGVRPLPEFARLRDLAARSGELLDLDKVNADELRSDLRQYLVARLADMPGYASAAQRPVRQALATTIADRLVVEGRRENAARSYWAARLGRTPARPPEWGAFLVAGMFVAYLDSVVPVTEPKAAALLGATVPRSLPAVLELELGVRPDRERLRATLAALAHAKGEGMPADVVGLVAAGFSATAHGDDVDALVNAGRFYLRTTVERDGTTLYRLLHQSLADHLRRSPTGVRAHAATVDTSAVPASATVVFDRLLAAVRGGAWGRWSSAPPYLLRHAIHHATEVGRVDELLTDVEFLLHADRATLLSELHRASSDDARTSAEVYRRAAHLWSSRHTYDVESRRWTLALEAARMGKPELGQRIATGPAPGGWRPRWSTAFPFGGPGRVTAATCADSDTGTVVVAAGTTGTVVRLRTLDGTPVGQPLAGHAGHLSAVEAARVDGRNLVFAGGADGHLRLWDADSGHLVDTFPARCGWINAIAAARRGDSVLAITCGDEAVRLWNPLGTPPVPPVVSHRWGRAVAVTEIEQRLHVITVANDHGVRVWDLADGTLRYPPMRAHRDRVYSVACTTLNGDPIAVTGGDDDALRVWDLADGSPIGDPLLGHTTAIAAVACTTVDGRPTVFSGGLDHTIRLWDLPSGTCRETLQMPAAVTALAVAPDGGLVVATESDVMILERSPGGRA